MSRTRDTGLRLTHAGNEVAFTLDGRLMQGIAGEPIAAALHAAGVSVMSRSFKYNRPRGLHCMADSCPNCAMRVNGLPGATTCVTPLRAGDVIEREHAWPSAEHSVLGLIDRGGERFGAGFQYRAFRSAPRAFRAWEWLLARIAGHGTLPDRSAARRVVADARWRECAVDVAVIGGGPAGMVAASAAAAKGARVLLVERDRALGGWLLSGNAERREQAAALEGDLDASPTVRVLRGATAIGAYDEQVLGVASADGLLAVRAAAVLLCSGSHERRWAFENADIPGVFVGSGAQRLLHRHGILPGRRVVVATDEDYGYELAEHLHLAGAELIGILDARQNVSSAETSLDRIGGMPRLHGARPVRAHGRNRLAGVTVTTGDASTRRFSCDALLVAAGRRPALELLHQRRGTVGLAGTDSSGTEIPDWVVAGGANGAETIEQAIADGRQAGAGYVRGRGS